MSRATPIFPMASSAANANLKRINLLAEKLAAAMKEAHGGEWRVQINHDPNACFAMVAPRLDRKITKPKPEGVI